VSAAPTLAGETVSISCLADPTVGHGLFRLENPGPEPLLASVESARFDSGSERRPLPELHLYDLDRGRPLDSGTLALAARSSVRFLVGFPSFSYAPPAGEDAAVRLVLRAGGRRLEARSPIELEQRKPLL